MEPRPVEALRYRPMRGVAYMGLAVLALTSLGAMVKWLTADYSPFQIGFLRYAIGILFALAIAATQTGGLGSLKTQRPTGHGLRAVVNLGTMLTYYYALALIPLADAIALSYVAPLFMTALSVPLLEEQVGWRRWLAVGVGFAGVLVMLQPSGTGIGWGAALAIVSAFLWALTVIASRQLSSSEPSHTILFYYSLAVLIATGATMPWLWVTPQPGDWLIFLGVGIVGSIGQFAINQAFRYGEVSLLAPIDYSGLAIGVFYGFWLWTDLPSATVLIGAALVIAAALYIVQREARLKRPSP